MQQRRNNRHQVGLAAIPQLPSVIRDRSAQSPAHYSGKFVRIPHENREIEPSIVPPGSVIGEAIAKHDRHLAPLQHKHQFSGLRPVHRRQHHILLMFRPRAVRPGNSCRARDGIRESRYPRGPAFYKRSDRTVITCKRYREIVNACTRLVFRNDVERLLLAARCEHQHCHCKHRSHSRFLQIETKASAHAVSLSRRRISCSPESESIPECVCASLPLCNSAALPLSYSAINRNCVLTTSTCGSSFPLFAPLSSNFRNVGSSRCS